MFFQHVACALCRSRRCGYLESQAKILLHTQDELAHDEEKGKKSSPFAKALEVSQLARDLKRVFHDISQTGMNRIMNRMINHIRIESTKDLSSHLLFRVCGGSDQQLVGDPLLPSAEGPQEDQSKFVGRARVHLPMHGAVEALPLLALATE